MKLEYPLDHALKRILEKESTKKNSSKTGKVLKSFAPISKTKKKLL
jgi:hypothetical protein